jgi:hypothetical protein
LIQYFAHNQDYFTGLAKNITAKCLDFFEKANRVIMNALSVQNEPPNPWQPTRL